MSPAGISTRMSEPTLLSIDEDPLITSEMLDSAVHDGASQIGSRANNEGKDDQLALIAKANGTESESDPRPSEELDDEVHDAASRIGSRINNEGKKEQLRFLREDCGWSDADIRDALQAD